MKPKLYIIMYVPYMYVPRLMYEEDKKRLFEAQISALLVLRQEDYDKVAMNVKQKKFINNIRICANRVGQLSTSVSSTSASSTSASSTSASSTSMSSTSTSASSTSSTSTSDISDGIDDLMAVLYQAYNKATEEERENFITKEVDDAILRILYRYRST